MFDERIHSHLALSLKTAGVLKMRRYNSIAGENMYGDSLCT